MESSKISPLEKKSSAPVAFIVFIFIFCLAFISFLQFTLPSDKNWTYSCLVLIAGIVFSIGSVLKGYGSPVGKQKENPSPFFPKNHLNEESPIILSDKDLQVIVQQLKLDLEQKESFLKNFEEKITQKNEEIQLKQGEINSLQSSVKNLKEEIEEKVSKLQKQEGRFLGEQNRKDSLLKEYKTTIAQQREIIEKKQNYNSKLEVKVADLSYEIKALLQLEDFHHSELKPSLPHSALPNSEFDHYNIDSLYETIQGTEKDSSNFDAFSLLDKYAVLAQNFKPSETFRSPRSSLSSSRFHLDLRHLYDILEREEQFILFVYSLLEQKIIFTNKKSKQILAYSPDSFSHNFKELIQKGRSGWENAINQIDTEEKQNLRLIIKSQSQEDILFHCYLEKIPKGIFNSFCLGLLIPS
jgi:hypothetical protein